jgi:hypothetical protein
MDVGESGRGKISFGRIRATKDRTRYGLRDLQQRTLNERHPQLVLLLCMQVTYSTSPALSVRRSRLPSQIRSTSTVHRKVPN